MRKLNKILIILVLLIPAKAFCQEFSHTVQLQKVTGPGFYSLAIEPALSAHLDASLKDLRIVDERRRPVPYIVNSSLPGLTKANTASLPIIENSVRDSGRSYIVLENSAQQNIDGIALLIRNATVSRTARISGSDDRSNWFTIQENLSFTSGRFSDSTHFILTLDIPKSSYKYFRLTIDNLNNDPLNIVQAKTYWSAVHSEGSTTSSSSELFLLSFINPVPGFSQVDSSDGYSYIRVIQPASYHVNTIQLETKGTRFFRRPLQVIAAGQYYDFLFSAGDQYSLPRFAAKEFTIKIYNGDNPPVQVTKVVTSQEKKQVVAYLEPQHQYSLLLGNPLAERPVYDLEHFRDSISNPQPISMGAIQANIQSIVKEEDKTNMSLWLIIIGVLGILSFFTWNLTRELKKRNH